MSGWVTGRVVALRRWTERLCSLQVEAAVEPFRAGQYNRLRLRVAGEWVARPYSYVNAPAVRPLEFYLTEVPGGPLSGRLLRLQPGDTVELMPRASGLFTLDQVPPAHALWLLATGTGLGPFLAILGAGEVWSRFATVCLVHGVRTPDEFGYREQLQQWQADSGGRLRYLPLLSRASESGVISGRVTTALLNGDLETQADLDIAPGRSQVMLCGNPGMVQEVQHLLAARGLVRNRRGHPGQITVENYW